MNETENRNVDVDSIHTRLLYLGLVMNVLAPVLLLSFGVFLKSKGIGGDMGAGRNTFFWVLIAVAFSEIPVIYLVRKTTLSARKAYLDSHPQAIYSQLLFQWGIIIFAISLSPAFYGLIYYLMGGTLERFMLFVAFTLLCFMLFKPKLEELYSIVEKRYNADENVKGV
ncbi:MAG TPA: hypothetical protein VF369_02405 [candidate division Zixibacteria bacterium]